MMMMIILLLLLLLSLLNIATGDGQKTVTISFEEFKKKKESARQSLFKITDKKGKHKLKKELAKIQVGLVSADRYSSQLKKVKGRTIPVLLSTDADATSLLSTAVEKHGRHFKQFNPLLEYVVLYPDMSLVRFLEGQKPSH